MYGLTNADCGKFKVLDGEWLSGGGSANGVDGTTASCPGSLVVTRLLVVCISKLFFFLSG